MNLIKDIKEWEQDDAAHQSLENPGKQLFQPTNNVSRETFNAVRDNPGRTRVEITLMLTARGFNKSSVGSLLGQMVRQKMLREISGSLYAVNKEYTPVKAYHTLKNKAKPKQTPKAVPKKDEGIAALPAAATAPVLVKPEWDAKTMIDHLSVRQARALYEELKNLFEGQ